MRLKYIYIVLSSCLLLVGCGTKKGVVESQESRVESAPEVPAWHTCLIQGARATIILGEEKISASATMQVVRDSMLVISIMPIAGLEVARFEATPTEIVGINKIEGTYAVTSYEHLNRKLIPHVYWETLQQLCSAELPTGAEKGRLVYTLDAQTIEISVVYPTRKLDVPVRVMHLRTDKYKQVDISKWL